MSKFLITGKDPASQSLVTAGIIRQEELDEISSVTIDFKAGSAAQVTIVKFLDDEVFKYIRDYFVKEAL